MGVCDSAESEGKRKQRNREPDSDRDRWAKGVWVEDRADDGRRWGSELSVAEQHGEKRGCERDGARIDVLENS